MTSMILKVSIRKSSTFYSVRVLSGVKLECAFLGMAEGKGCWFHECNFYFVHMQTSFVFSYAFQGLRPSKVWTESSGASKVSSFKAI